MLDGVNVTPTVRILNASSEVKRLILHVTTSPDAEDKGACFSNKKSLARTVLKDHRRKTVRSGRPFILSPAKELVDAETSTVDRVGEPAAR